MFVLGGLAKSGVLTFIIITATTNTTIMITIIVAHAYMQEQMQCPCRDNHFVTAMPHLDESQCSYYPGLPWLRSALFCLMCVIDRSQCNARAVMITFDCNASFRRKPVKVPGGSMECGIC